MMENIMITEKTMMENIPTEKTTAFWITQETMAPMGNVVVLLL